MCPMKMVQFPPCFFSFLIVLMKWTVENAWRLCIPIVRITYREINCTPRTAHDYRINFHLFTALLYNNQSTTIALSNIFSPNIKAELFRFFFPPRKSQIPKEPRHSDVYHEVSFIRWAVSRNLCLWISAVSQLVPHHPSVQCTFTPNKKLQHLASCPCLEIACRSKITCTVLYSKTQPCQRVEVE